MWAWANALPSMGFWSGTNLSASNAAACNLWGLLLDRIRAVGAVKYLLAAGACSSLLLQIVSLAFLCWLADLDCVGSSKPTEWFPWTMVPESMSSSCWGQVCKCSESPTKFAPLLLKGYSGDFEVWECEAWACSGETIAVLHWHLGDIIDPAQKEC